MITKLITQHLEQLFVDACQRLTEEEIGVILKAHYFTFHCRTRGWIDLNDNLNMIRYHNINQFSKYPFAKMGIIACVRVDVFRDSPFV